MPAKWIEDEDKWEKARQIVQDEYGLTESDGDKFWALVMGVYKKAKGRIEHKGSRLKLKQPISRLKRKRPSE